MLTSTMHALRDHGIQSCMASYIACMFGNPGQLSAIVSHKYSTIVPVFDEDDGIYEVITGSYSVLQIIIVTASDSSFGNVLGTSICNGNTCEFITGNRRLYHNEYP